MKNLLTISFAATLALVARADTFNFTPSDADIGDLDHHYAYTWGINWSLPTDTKITGVTLSIKNIWDWRVENDKLFIHLLDNPATGIKSILDNTNDNVISDYFDGQGTLLTSWSDPYGGFNRGFTLNYNFTAAQISTLTGYLTDGQSGGSADFGIAFDPDCHYFNDGITLSIKTEHVPDGGLTVLMLGVGLIALSSLRRFLPS